MFPCLVIRKLIRLRTGCRVVSLMKSIINCIIYVASREATRTKNRSIPAANEQTIFGDNIYIFIKFPRFHGFYFYEIGWTHYLENQKYVHL